MLSRARGHGFLGHVEGTRRIIRGVRWLGAKGNTHEEIHCRSIWLFLLVFIGVGSIVTGGFGGALPIGQIGIDFSFGLAVTAAAYTIGPVSGAHLNPAVTLGVWLAGRMPAATARPI